jgi:hypothetical protein
MKRLPASRHTLYLGAWGLTAIIAANDFIGGLDHWLNYLPGKNKNKVIPHKPRHKVLRCRGASAKKPPGTE